MAITYKSGKEIELMRESGIIAAIILKHLVSEVKPGVTTQHLNDLAEQLITEHKVKPAFKNYQGFPGVLCTSVNEVIVHGAPSDRSLAEGDGIGLDFGVIYEGWYSDTALTVPVGEPSYELARIIRVCKKALRLGIKKAKPGSTTGDIGNTIQRYVESEGYSLVRELVGHGIGRELHEDPQVPNYGKRHTGTILKPGMVIAIEPMIVEGKADLKMHSDRHGYASKEHHLTAHFEHTVAIMEKGPEILTRL